MPGEAHDLVSSRLLQQHRLLASPTKVSIARLPKAGSYQLRPAFDKLRLVLCVLETFTNTPVKGRGCSCVRAQQFNEYSSTLLRRRRLFSSVSVKALNHLLFSDPPRPPPTLDLPSLAASFRATWVTTCTKILTPHMTTTTNTQGPGLMVLMLISPSMI